MRVFLTGFMGAGKTTVGRLLAAAMGGSFVDLDVAIEERAGRSVRRIFELDGEAEFRRLESRELEAVVAGDYEGGVVVATGGGTMSEPENRRLMHESGSVVWLDAAFDVLSARLGSAESARRPLFGDPTEARRLFEERLEIYAKAGFRIEITDRDVPRDVASRILAMLGDKSCAT